MKLKGKNRTLDEGVNEVVSNEGEGGEGTQQATPIQDLPPELTDPKNPKYLSIIKNKKARAQVKERKVVIIIAIVLLVLMLIGIAIYGFFAAVEVNNFSIYVQNEGSRILSLSSEPDFNSATQFLEVSGPEFMDNTSIYMSPFGDIPIEEKLLDIAEGEGTMNTADDKYIAVSFYLKNITSDKQYYNEVFKINQSTQGMEKALRVMLIKDYNIEVYAAKDSEGNPEKVVCTELAENTYSPLEFVTNAEGVREIHHKTEEGSWYSTPFYDDQYVFYNQGFELAPEQVIKYSLVIWLEGWDPDCVNEIIGGQLKIDFAFEVAPKPEK